MSSATRIFCSLVALAILVAAGLGTASIRLLLPLAAGAGSTVQAIGRWCLLLLTGSPETDELLLLALIGLLLAALLLGLNSLGRQLRTTDRLVQGRIAGRRRHPPRWVGKLCDQLDLTNQADVVEAEQPYAFCYGLLRPRICLSTRLVRVLSQAELEAVLLHERCHLRSRDPLRVLLTRALSQALFFVPVVAELAHHFLMATELAADDHAIRAQGQGRQLASALYKLSAPTSSLDLGPAAIGLGTVTDARIDHLLDPHIPVAIHVSRRSLAMSTVTLLAVAAAALSPDLAGVGLHAHALVDSAVRVCFL